MGGGLPHLGRGKQRESRIIGDLWYSGVQFCPKASHRALATRELTTMTVKNVLPDACFLFLAVDADFTFRNNTQARDLPVMGQSCV